VDRCRVWLDLGEKTEFGDMETPDEVKEVHKMTEEITETHKSSLSSHEELQLPLNDKNKFLVIDTGAIVKGQTNLFHQTANRFVTVQEVLGEVRDSKSRELLASLPFELEVRAPSDTAMKIVYDFAKKTGDFAALSLCDIKIMALTYDLEIQNHQKMFIRDAPMVLLFLPVPSPLLLHTSLFRELVILSYQNLNQRRTTGSLPLSRRLPRISPAAPVRNKITSSERIITFPVCSLPLSLSHGLQIKDFSTR
jgi:hypothetical protein